MASRCDEYWPWKTLRKSRKFEAFTNIKKNLKNWNYFITKWNFLTFFRITKPLVFNHFDQDYYTSSFLLFSSLEQFKILPVLAVDFLNFSLTSPNNIKTTHIFLNLLSHFTPFTQIFLEPWKASNAKKTLKKKFSCKNQSKQPQNVFEKRFGNIKHSHEI